MLLISHAVSSMLIHSVVSRALIDLLFNLKCLTADGG
jgi:hypothetical protein